MVKVRIPATSANIGSGFDSLGLAAGGMYNYVYLKESDNLTIKSLDNAPIPLDKNNLVYKTVLDLYNLCGKKLHGLEIQQISNIPFARGLGSSSACIIGGIVGANKLLNSPLNQDEIINMAAAIEGHPDNTTPALVGGLVTAVLSDKKVHYVKQDVGGELKLAAIIPDFELKTTVARQVLPQDISHMDARYNLGRAALMAVSLYSGKYENLKIAAEDKLHQPYRLSMIPNAQAVMNMCYNNGAYAVYISGAGPTIMAIYNDAVLDFPQKTIFNLKDMGLTGWRVEILDIDNKGAILMTD